MQDYSDPVAEMEWLDEQEEHIQHYLTTQPLAAHGELEIEWCLAPYVSIWTIETASGGPRLWVISGDLPTDYIDGADVSDARSAARAFAERWDEVARHMLRGEAHPSVAIGDPHDPQSLKELGDLLQKRAAVLHKWTHDESVWEQ